LSAKAAKRPVFVRGVLAASIVLSARLRFAKPRSFSGLYKRLLAWLLGQA